ncbi:hypothetical protein [Pelagibius sp.]|uniref:hypothetical protein n=1 Tax=Pelagibius sp. TaxID=1931238 RepID=UPI00260BD86D|nr:hypothetical protein [Pelagibius sp.]
MEWGIDGGDILQVAAFLVAAVIFVLRIDKQLGIMKAEMKALEGRVNTLEEGLRDDVREIKDTINANARDSKDNFKAVFERLDHKADK